MTKSVRYYGFTYNPITRKYDEVLATTHSVRPSTDTQTGTSYATFGDAENGVSAKNQSLVKTGAWRV